MAIVINGSGTVTGISVGGLPDDIVDAGTLADNAVGLAQMASGTDGNIITYDTSGNPAVVATGSDGQVLTSAGADAVPAFEAAASSGRILQIVQEGGNTYTDASITNNTWTDTVVTAAITPASTSNKIFVSYRLAVHFTDSTGNAGYSLRCKRAISGGATTDNVGAGLATWGTGNCHTIFFMTTNTGNDANMMSTVNGVDTPSADTEVTYTVGVAGYNINGTIQAGGMYSGNWSVTLMEIEG